MKLKLVVLSSVLGILTVNSTYAQVGAPPRGAQPAAGPNQGPPPPGPAQGPGQAPPPSPGAGAPPPPPPPGGGGGGGGGVSTPLAGLSAAELTAFNAGRGDFVTVETPASGLGPIFNENSCVACHQNPAAGGTSGAPATAVTRFGRTTGGTFDAMTSLGGSLLQARAINPAAQEFVPATATIRATRITTPIFGAGLIEAIPDATIQAQANLAKPDGVRGRAAIVVDVASGQNRVGRFGWKAQQATLLAFSGDAYLNEMGITNRLFPAENAPNGNVALLNQYNNRVTFTGLQAPPDPATGLTKVDRVASFMRFLAPPPVNALSTSATAGQTVFQQAGCAVCHTPTMQTGTNNSTALSNKTVRLYSDLLLHNMGSLNDGIAQGGAAGNEMKTAPLWGLRSRPTWLHDGSARTINAAITAHDGEAAISKGRYQQLSAAQRQQLLDFLNAL